MTTLPVDPLPLPCSIRFFNSSDVMT
uniref:Uncharacterized protein n=1 Tax=Anguilla anguilla TaxID=7936 RepID=A0A0E9VTH6_ANGAN